MHGEMDFKAYFNFENELRKGLLGMPPEDIVKLYYLILVGGVTVWHNNIQDVIVLNIATAATKFIPLMKALNKIQNGYIPMDEVYLTLERGMFLNLLFRPGNIFLELFLVFYICEYSLWKFLWLYSSDYLI